MGTRLLSTSGGAGVRSTQLQPTHVQLVPPSLAYPAGQPQVRLPVVLVQTPMGSQPPFAVAHSLMSAQEPPSPVNPVRHAHAKPPVLLVQFAFGWHAAGEA